MDERQLERLRDDVFAAATMRASRDHGEQHWKAVAWAGLELAQRTPRADPLVVLLFAWFHDALRENEYHDPEHGLRGAELSRSLHGSTNLLGAADQALLYEACRDHTEVEHSPDPTIGACWDADRVNLWRVGIEPDPRYLSTPRAVELLPESAQYHHREYDWGDLTRAYVELHAGS